MVATLVLDQGSAKARRDLFNFRLVSELFSGICEYVFFRHEGCGAILRQNLNTVDYDMTERSMEVIEAVVQNSRCNTTITTLRFMIRHIEEESAAAWEDYRSATHISEPEICASLRLTKPLARKAPVDGFGGTHITSRKRRRRTRISQSHPKRRSHVDRFGDAIQTLLLAGDIASVEFRRQKHDRPKWGDPFESHWTTAFSILDVMGTRSKPNTLNVRFDTIDHLLFRRRPEFLSAACTSFFPLTHITLCIESDQIRRYVAYDGGWANALASARNLLELQLILKNRPACGSRSTVFATYFSSMIKDQYWPGLRRFEIHNFYALLPQLKDFLRAHSSGLRKLEHPDLSLVGASMCELEHFKAEELSLE